MERVVTTLAKPFIESPMQQGVGNKDEGNFYVLRQDGIAAVRETVVFNKPFPHVEKNATRTNISKVRAERQRLQQLLGIVRMDEIPELISNPELRAERTERAYKLIAGSYELVGTREEIIERVNDVGRLADSTIDVATQDLPFPLSEQGKDSIIRSMHNPVDLALAMHDSSLSPLERFRAKRKLLLMGLGGSVDFREREIKTDEAYQRFNAFLEQHVFNPQSEDDKKERYILSTHDSDTFATLTTTIIGSDEKDSLELKPGQKLTPIQKRTFTVDTPKGPQEISVYIASREKDIPTQKRREKMLLKLFRKGHENPALAVDDQVGIMPVFDTPRELYLFLKHLSAAATKAGTLLTFEEVEDTLNGEAHKPSSAGSSSDLHWFKSFFRMDGIRPEFVGHTKNTLTDYLYKRGLSHREYSNERFIASGVMELLFPHDLYKYNPIDVHEYVSQKVREEVENPYHIQKSGR